jgi:DNA-binding SARP family transcriptional activator/tetratricopeptide (TPR) repeat protein
VVLISEGVLRPVGSRSLRTLLAVLGLRAGEAVNVDQLMDALWAGRPPATGVNTLQRHLSALRAELPAGVTLAVQAPGYRLGAAASGEVTDVQAAERLIKQARSAARPVDRAAALRRALDLWRGEPLADVAPSEYVAGHAARLAMMWTRARADLARARLELGDSADVVPDLTDLTTAEPYDEDLHGLLMMALYRSGRQAEALAVSRRLRETLADQLGIDPGEAIQSLETRILRQDPRLLGGAPGGPLESAIAARLPETPVPAQLPASVAGFTGRRRELAELDAPLDFDEPGRAVVISAVSGTAGIGKTALAVEWAHRAAGRFPDGQLYANLRGFDPQRPPVEPGAVLRGFLEGLGVATARIPDDLDAQSALLRSLLASRRVLLLLDNARDAEQVRPLLPGSSRCLAIVTSRNRLSSLAALEGARLVPLDLLSEAEARELLARRLGRDRVETDADAVDEIIDRCGGLPLALAVVAGRAAARPYLPLTSVVAELAGVASRLDAIRGEDAATDLRAVFLCSYDALSPGAAQVLRQIGVHPGPDLSAAAALSLSGLEPAACAAALSELVAGSLVSEPVPGRYAVHDLLRAFALERLEASGDDVTLVRQRLLDHYLHTAHAAALLIGPLMESITLPEPAAGVRPEHLEDNEAAARWFRSERAVLLGAVDNAAAQGFPRHAWRLAWCLDTHLHRAGRWPDQVRMHTVAARAASAAGEDVGAASCLRFLARAQWMLEDWPAAEAAAQQALACYERLGDPAQVGHTLIYLSAIAGLSGRTDDVAVHVRRALPLFEAVDDQMGLGVAYNNLAEYYFETGDYENSLDCCRRSLQACRRSGDTDIRTAAWLIKGQVHRNRAELPRSLACYRTAARLSAVIGDRYKRAVALSSAAEIHLERGSRDDAVRALREALDLFDLMDHPSADEVRARLEGLAAT